MNDNQQVDRQAGHATDPAEKAFTRFFINEYSQLMRFLLKAGASIEEAQDVVQEAMIQLYKDWNEVTNPRAWIRVVALRTHHRLALRTRRPDHAAVTRSSSQFDLIQPAADASVDLGLEGHLVREAIRQLPERQRQVFALVVDGFTTAEIAKMLGLTRGTVRVHLMEARKRLKEWLSEDDTPRSGRKADG